MLESLFDKVTGLQVLRPATLLKRDSNTLPCEICEIFKNTYFEEHLRMAASGINITFGKSLQYTKAVAQRCSVKTMSLEISQNSQENTCARVSFLIKLQTSGFY